MQRTKIQVTLLQGLLDECGGHYTLRPDELNAIHNHLFGEPEPLPFVQDTELHETIFYLQQWVAIKQFRTLEELAAYYEGKKKDLWNHLPKIMQPGDTFVPKKWFTRIRHELMGYLYRLWQQGFAGARVRKYLYKRALSHHKRSVFPW